MIDARYLILLLLTPLLGLSWLLLAAVEPEGPNQLEHFIIGFLLGTMFGQATLASAWAALGPAPLLWRLPLSLGWVAILVIAFLVNISVNNFGGNIEVALILGGCLGGQWLLVQMPLWGLALGYGVNLRHRDDPPLAIRERQFGIRQLMILTAIVAVVLGACRWVVTAAMAELQGTNWGEAAVFFMLAAAGIVMTLPLIIAALLPRFAWLATAGVLVLIWLGTWYELPLVNMVGGGPNIWHLAFINGFQAAWVLAVVGLLRLCGYGIGQPARPQGECPFASTP